jgi:hypothetical protein
VHLSGTREGGTAPFFTPAQERTVIELVEYALEGSSHNEHASCVVLYYAGVPTKEQVVADLMSLQGQLGLFCDTADPTFSYEEFPTKVSERAGLHRYECYPCG